MYAEGDSAWGNSFTITKDGAYIQLRLYAQELSEQLRLVDPYENDNGPFNETASGQDDSSKKLLDDVDFPTSDYSQSGFIQAVILQAQDLDLLGLPDAEFPLTSIETYCCTPFYVDQGLCPESDLGSLIIDRNISAFDIWTYDIPLLPHRPANAAEGTAAFIERRSPSKRSAKENQRGTFHVKHTGEHVLILSHCDPTLNTEISISGTTEWKNPFGYLPGQRHITQTRLHLNVLFSLFLSSHHLYIYFFIFCILYFFILLFI